MMTLVPGAGVAFRGGCSVWCGYSFIILRFGEFGVDEFEGGW